MSSYLRVGFFYLSQNDIPCCSFWLLNDFWKALYWHSSVSTSVQKHFSFLATDVWKNVSLCREIWTNRGGLILCSDIKKINLNMQFVHYIFLKNVAVYFQIHGSLWAKKKAGHPEKLLSYFKFREMCSILRLSLRSQISYSWGKKKCFLVFCPSFNFQATSTVFCMLLQRVACS